MRAATILEGDQMVVILKRAAASLLVGASLLVSGAQAQLWDAATEPVRQMFERDNLHCK